MDQLLFLEVWILGELSIFAILFIMWIPKPWKRPGPADLERDCCCCQLIFVVGFAMWALTFVRLMATIGIVQLYYMQPDCRSSTVGQLTAGYVAVRIVSFFLYFAAEKCGIGIATYDKNGIRTLDETVVDGDSLGAHTWHIIKRVVKRVRDSLPFLVVAVAIVGWDNDCYCKNIELGDSCKHGINPPIWLILWALPWAALIYLFQSGLQAGCILQQSKREADNMEDHHLPCSICIGCFFCTVVMFYVFFLIPNGYIVISENAACSGKEATYVLVQVGTYLLTGIFGLLCCCGFCVGLAGFCGIGGDW